MLIICVYDYESVGCFDNNLLCDLFGDEYKNMIDEIFHWFTVDE